MHVHSHRSRVLFASLLFALFCGLCGCAAGPAGVELSYADPTGLDSGDPSGSATGSDRYGTGALVGSVEPVATDAGTSYLSSVLLDGSSTLRWTSSEVRVAIDTRDVPEGWRPAYVEHVMDGLRLRAGGVDGQLDFLVVSEAPDISVSWVDSIPSDASLVTGVTEITRTSTEFYPIAVKLALNAGTLSLNNAELKATAVHELGHAIGLTGHSPNSPDVMYYASYATTLTANDVTTLRDLYSRPADIQPTSASSLGVRGAEVIRFYAHRDGSCTCDHH